MKSPQRAGERVVEAPVREAQGGVEGRALIAPTTNGQRVVRMPFSALIVDRSFVDLIA